MCSKLLIDIIIKINLRIYNIIKMEEIILGQYHIKSKYFGEWQRRAISYNFKKNILGVSSHGASLFKHFNFGQLRLQDRLPDLLLISTPQGRDYEIKGLNIHQVMSQIESLKFIHKLASQKDELTVSFPVNINYHQNLKSRQSNRAKDQERKEVVSILQEKVPEKLKEYRRQKSYLKQQDWSINQDGGGLTLISDQKKQNQSKILKFILKKFITTGSFMGISFPVFAMKPESILQTYCKSISAAPIIFLPETNDPIQRIKQFVAFIFTFSRLFSDMDKPFNPTIGQTFQAQIGGGTFSAEQTSHHPPQSSILFEGENFTISGTLELIAQIGINSATGMIQGDVIVTFQEGQKLIGRLISGQMSGFILGENRFKPDGSCYVYDQKRKVLASFSCQKRDIFNGFIGKLQKSKLNKFQKLLKQKERFTNFAGHEMQDYSEIYSTIEVCWSKYIKFDRKVYLDFLEKKWLPYQPSYEGIELLDSDSRHRKDIQLREMREFDLSQEEKERIEQQQRNFRKLRANYAKRTKRN